MAMITARSDRACFVTFAESTGTFGLACVDRKMISTSPSIKVR